MVSLEPHDVRFFESATELRDWFDANHETADELWLGYFRKSTGRATLDWSAAVDEALCVGWIDGVRRSLDAESYVQRFTPRKPRSLWSRVNRERAIALIKAKAMMPAGLAAVEVAKANGEWDRAYSPGSTITEPKDLLAALRKNPRAKAFYKELNAQNRFSILHRLEKSAKPETRAKRLAKFVEMLERGERIHA